MKRFFCLLLLCLSFTSLISCKKEPPAGSWTPIATGKDNTFFELNFVNPEVGWLTGWHEKGPEVTGGWEVLQTRDGGKSWFVMVKQAEQKIQYVYFATDKLGWALNLNHDILATTDGGETWQVQRPVGKAKVKYFYNNPKAPTEVAEPLTRIHFFNEKSGWAWGGGVKKENEFEQEGIFLRTDDGGKNWTKIAYPFDNELKAIFFIDIRNGWASDSKAGIYKTVNGGRTWDKRPDDMRRPSINGIFFIDQDHGWIVGDRYIGITEDGGGNWERVKVDHSYLYNVYFVDAKHGWVVGDNNTIMRTTDGGHRWEGQESGLDGPVTFSQVKFFNDKSGWAAGLNGALLRYGVQQ